jgi:hypothetical protein
MLEEIAIGWDYEYDLRKMEENGMDELKLNGLCSSKLQVYCNFYEDTIDIFY